MAQPVRITCKVHTEGRKPGKLLKYSDGQTNFVKPDGSQIKVIIQDGKIYKPVKMNKKQRLKLKRENQQPK